MPTSTTCVRIVSECSVYPETKSTIGNLKLSVSDLPMLSCHYIQKGLLFTRPSPPTNNHNSLLSLLKRSLSQTLTLFPPLAGRLLTDSNGVIFITCNDFGADFIHANADHLSISDILSPSHVPSDSIKQFFAFGGAVSYDGHSKPILAVQVTELSDGVFIGCTVNHSVADGTSFWNFFNTFAEICREGSYLGLTKQPDFRRNYFKDSSAVIRFPDGPPKVTFDENAPIRERIFRFSRESILKLKFRANNTNSVQKLPNSVEIMGKQSNDYWKNNNNNKNNDDDENQNPNGMITSVIEKLFSTTRSKKDQGFETENVLVVDPTVEISSFQSLCAQLWRSITRARKLSPSKLTTFRMAVNCRQRIEPRVDQYYFGNAIQSIPTVASVGDVLSRDLRWCGAELNRNVLAHNDAKVRGCVEDWEKSPRCFPLGNLDGASITMGSSPRFPMYDNDFGWGRPLAIRSGKSNKFDGKISAFPGRDGNGSVDLEVCLSPETMAGLENDWEFMQYVTVHQG